MDHVTLGRRVAGARDDLDMSQGKLGELVGLDRTAINRAEKGERKLTMTEMVAIAEVLDRPLGYFVNDPLPAVVNRRADPALPHDTALDASIELFASDALMLVEMGFIEKVKRDRDARTPRNHQHAEQLARLIREDIGLVDGPLVDLGRVCERLGLYTYAAPLGENGPDGGCVQVSDEQESIAVAVVNGEARSGRRRMTLAHELGHWLCGDAYDASAGDDHERMINSFAIHFLAPRAGVFRVWNEHREWDNRDRALAVGAAFRLNWSATTGQLKNLEIISQDDFRLLGEREPRSGDYARLTLSWDDEPKCPYLSPAFVAACVQGYATGRLTAARTIEMLRGTMTRGDLPERELLSLNDIRNSFTGHGD